MKNKINLFLVFFSFTFFLFSCNQTTEETQKDTIDNTVSKEISDVSAKAMHFAVLNAGNEVAQIMINGQNIELKVGEIHYKSKIKGDKRKYQTREGGIVAEVKYKGDESLKLRTPEANLKWKIKFYDDKFKVSDNEENLNPYEVKFKEAARSKVYLDDAELGNVRFSENKIKVEGKGIEYSIDVNEMHPAFGILIMDMPEMDKIILIAEMIAKGK